MEIAMNINNDNRLPLHYVVSIPFGVLLGAIIDALYHGGAWPGRLIYHTIRIYGSPLHEYLPFSIYWTAVPFVVINGLLYWLYRSSRVASEQLFFLGLSAVLNGLALFTVVNVLNQFI
jgi:hypothetical protein